MVRDNIFPEAIERSESIAQSYRSFVKIRELSLKDSNENEMWNYRFLYSAGVRLIFSAEEEVSKDEDYQPLIEIVGVFEASYLSVRKLAEKNLMAYSVDNVGYHVWPYWREYVQSTCARIGYSPAFEVPVYRMTPKEANE